MADSLASRDPCGPACANSLAFGDRRRPPILLDEPLAAARDFIGKDRAARVMRGRVRGRSSRPGHERWGPVQRFLVDGRISILSFAFAFARLSARFSLRDLAAFLDMCCRGDLSAMVCLLPDWEPG